MPFSYRDLFCGGRTFCCCLPVRVGVIIMSLLGIVVAGVLSIVLWFEVASQFCLSLLVDARNDLINGDALGTPDMTSTERAGFILAGLVETLLFVASSLG